MTIAICLKVNDGLVLAADSASTLSNQSGQIIRVYNNANKICNLFKGKPIGFMTWAWGAIGRASTATLAKDLRQALMGAGGIDPQAYTIQDVAKRAYDFLRGLYDVEYSKLPPEQLPVLGFAVLGYGSGESLPETWATALPLDDAPKLVQARDYVGWNVWGDAEPLLRLLKGQSYDLPRALEQLGASPEDATASANKIGISLEAPIVFPSMPVQDAIDLGQFLADVAAGWSRFTKPHATVGGPIEIATITKHEGYKWISRKHYYDISVNQP